MSALLIRNARLATPVTGTNGSPQWQLREVYPAALYCADGVIAGVGRETDVTRAVPACDEVDAGGRLLTPGLVDCHTHPVFYNLRSHEFVQRIQGQSYAQIAARGGGIRYTVRDFREAPSDAVLERVLQRLDTFLSHGTTTIEVKSGYGLSLDHELRSLEIIQQANAKHLVDIVPTFLGAHEIPDEFRNRGDEYARLVIEEMIPAVAARNLARFADVFCESAVFSESQSRRILQAAAGYGLRPKIHADQLSDNGGARVAIDLHAVSADHLEFTPSSLYESLRRAGVVPVLLPGADFFIRASRYAPARSMIEAGLPVAIATDFNPGSCMTESLPMIMTLACLKMRMTPAETLVAATLHAAKALDLGNQIGSLEVGKQADAVLWEAESVNDIPYHFAVNLVHAVVKNGDLKTERQRTEK